MEYIQADEAASRWGVSKRLVQRYCRQGRIAGAEKVGGSWRIPEGAVKPGDPRRSRDQQPAAARPPFGTHRLSHLMPLMNTPFQPGTASAWVESLGTGTRAQIAHAELAYFTGDAERARNVAAPLLKSDDFDARLSACLICAYADLALERVNDARYALEGARGALGNGSGGGISLEQAALASFVARTASVLLHLPIPADLPPEREMLPLLPPGLRLFSCYVGAHQLYLEGERAQSLGVARGALAMGDAIHPIPAIYLHLVAVMDLMSLRRVDEARAHLLEAWELARPDNLIEPFGEHHGLLGGMLEAAIKPEWPEDFKRMIAITYRFSAGWRRVHNPSTGDDVADNLSTTEFAVCMLAARGWSNQEIAEHVGVSVNRVKECLSNSFRKLGVTSRKELGRFMLT